LIHFYKRPEISSMEVICDLLKGPVYLAGEEITCRITFSNNSAHTRGDSGCVLAWASAQLNCFCTVSDSKVAILDKSVTRKSSNPNGGVHSHQTSFQPTAGEAGLPVLSTPTKILFCDLTLHPGERKTFSYTETIPHSASPTYRGTAVKYSYKVTIGTQRLNCQTSMLRVPIRVLSIAGCRTDTVPCDREDRLGPTSPFLEEDCGGESPADLIMQSIQDITSKRRSSYFNIANSRGKVCKFCLYKRSYRLGEDIVGTFDFSVGNIQCVQYSVSLQLKEGIEAEYRVKEDQQDKIVTHSKHHEVCLGFSQSHMVLPIPLQLAPTFSTPICSVSYILHFEFVISVNGSAKQPVPEEEGGSEWQGPSKVDIETMVWDLPIQLYPTYPNHAAQASQLQHRLVSSV